MNIITMSNGKFYDGGARFRAIGGNNYGQLYTRNVAGSTDTVLDNFYSGCKRDGIRVIRSWAYNEPNTSPTANSDGNFRYWDGTQLVFREPQFVLLDRCLYYAAKYGIRLIISFSDFAAGGWVGKNMQTHDLKYGTHFQNGQTISVTSLIRTSNVATAITPVPHELYVGCLIQMIGANEAGFNGNGPKVIAVIDANTFQYSSTGADITATGTITMKRGDSFFSPTKQTFYHYPTMIQMQKEYIAHFLNRTNTIDGIPYNQHPAIFSYELGNELRYDQTNESNVNGVNSNNIVSMATWASTISSYIKSLDPNHLVGFGDMGHRAGYYTYLNSSFPDQFYNGSYYGTDPTVLSAISTIDYGDIHVYPYQYDNNQLRSNPGWIGLNEGFLFSAMGVKMGVQHIIRDVKALGKAMIVGEWGVVKSNTSNDRYVNYPRHYHFMRAMNDFYEGDGDLFIMWHYYPTDTQGQFDDNYGIKAQGWYSQLTNLPGRNDSDAVLLSYCKQKDRVFRGEQIVATDIMEGTPLGRNP